MAEAGFGRCFVVSDQLTNLLADYQALQSELKLKKIPEGYRAQRRIAVRKNAVQSFRDMAVVFAKIGNTFEVRMLQFGAQDAEYIEVTSGLKPGTEYATDNSFVLKADVLKSGASHDH